MTEQIQVRMDRGDTYSTVHGERAPDDPHATTHFYQHGLPFDGEGFLILDHVVFENDKGDRCSRKAAELRGKAYALIERAKKRERKRLAAQAEEEARNPRRRRPAAATAPAPVAERPIVVPPPLVDPSKVGTVETTEGPGNSFGILPEPEPVDTETGFGTPEQDEDIDEEFDIGADDDDDDDDEDHDPNVAVKVNMEAYLRGEEDVQWHVLTQEIAVRFARRVPNLREAVIFLVEDPEGPKVIPKAQLAPRFLKHLD